jgi:hypothetical protein
MPSAVLLLASGYYFIEGRLSKTKTKRRYSFQKLSWRLLIHGAIASFGLYKNLGRSARLPSALELEHVPGNCDKLGTAFLRGLAVGTILRAGPQADPEPHRAAQRIVERDAHARGRLRADRRTAAARRAARAGACATACEEGAAAAGLAVVLALF